MTTQNAVKQMKTLSDAELAAVSGGMMGALPSGVAAGAAQVANAGGICDYHHMQQRTYCFNDALGPDSFYWVN